MFWNSVIGGLKVFTFWELYVASLLFIVISVGPLMATGLLAEKNEAIGCLGMLIVPVFQALATIIFIFTMFPILIGIAEDAAWSFPWKILFSNPWFMLKSSLIIFGATFMLAFIPLLGRFHSVTTFATGSLAIVLLLRVLHVDKIQIMPSFLIIFGYLIIGGILSWISTMLIAIISSAMGEISEDIALLVAIPIGGILGFIPVFFYSSYIGIQLI